MPVAAEVATGVLSNIVFEGLRRPLNALTAEVRRHDQVGRALGDRAATRSIKSAAQIDQILNDLTRVIGNNQGKLTTRVAAFLAELKRTAFPEAIAQTALCGGDASPLLESFTSFYKGHAPLPFSAEQLFNGLHQACIARIEAVDDKALLEIIRAQHADLSERLELISLSIANSLHSKYSFGTDELREARLRSAKAIEAAHRYVSVETLQGAKKFKLTSLAIPGRLSELTDLQIQSARSPSSTAPSISYLTFRKQFNRGVILGDPGGGKTTLTQLMCYDLANLIGLEAATQKGRSSRGGI